MSNTDICVIRFVFTVMYFINEGLTYQKATTVITMKLSNVARCNKKTVTVVRKDRGLTAHGQK